MRKSVSHEKIREVRTENTQLRKENATLHRNLSRVKKNLDTARSEKAELKAELESVKYDLDIAKRDNRNLGDELLSVTDSLMEVKAHIETLSKHFKRPQRFEDIVYSVSAQLKYIADHLGVNSTFGDIQTAVLTNISDLTELEDRGFFRRLFNLKPKPTKEDRMWDKPSKPITPTPKAEA